MTLEDIMTNEMQSIHNADMIAKYKQDVEFNNMMEKCYEIVDKISFLKKYRFSFRVYEKDSYGKRDPHITLYYNDKYFCFLSPCLDGEHDFKGNDLYRYFHPCTWGTCEKLVQIIGQILMGK